MDQDRLLYLLERYGMNDCGKAELEELDEWFHAHQPGRENLDYWLREAGGPEGLSQSLFKDFKSRLKKPSKVINIQRIYKAGAAAAAIIAVLLLSLHLRHHDQPETARLSHQPAPPPRHKIKPGSNKATLTLASGTVIALDDSVTGAIAVQNNTAVTQVQKGNISYDAVSNPSSEDRVAYNTLTTPRGGKYTIKLADGTIVTLDAASSITYPVAFSGKERRVQITGQAYFEVVHHPEMPFRVTAKGQTIEDIGTSFNVNAYDDDPSLKITLAEGRVDVRNADRSVSLLPGQQALVNNGQRHIQVKTVNVEETVAWKNGWFVIHNESLKDVMKQAGRWYDVDVIYEGNLTNKEFGGTISRYKEISELMHNLQIAGGINYRIEGRKVFLF